MKKQVQAVPVLLVRLVLLQFQSLRKNLAEPLHQQGDVLERYFRQAAELMRALQTSDAPSPTK